MVAGASRVQAVVTENVDLVGDVARNHGVEDLGPFWLVFVVDPLLFLFTFEKEWGRFIVPNKPFNLSLLVQINEPLLVEGILKFANIIVLFRQYQQVEIIDEEADVRNDFDLELEHVFLMVVNIVPLRFLLLIFG